MFIRGHPLGLVALHMAVGPAAVAADSPTILFPMKTFADAGHMVHVEGTLSGDGVGYPSNTSALTCYQERRECEMVVVSAAGLQVFSLGIPEAFTVRVWEPDRIVADLAAPCGNPPNAVFAREWQASTSETLIIDRKLETAELSVHPCNEAKLYHWTIENPPFWQKMEKQ